MARRPYKGELLDIYIRENDYIHRSDLHKMGYANPDLALRKYCEKTGTVVEQKNYYMWIKTGTAEIADKYQVAVESLKKNIKKRKISKEARERINLAHRAKYAERKEMIRRIADK